MSLPRFLPVALFTLPALATLLLGCPSLTRPNEGDPGYGTNAMGPSPLGTVANARPTAQPNGQPNVQPSAKPRPAVPADSPQGEKIRASHILVGWKGTAGPKQERTKEEAKKRIDDIIARLKKGEDFAKLAADFGEDGTKTRGGDLGLFEREGMVKPFADAAFALKPGETSGVVETQFGYHVIKRTQ